MLDCWDRPRLLLYKLKLVQWRILWMSLLRSTNRRSLKPGLAKCFLLSNSILSSSIVLMWFTNFLAVNVNYRQNSCVIKSCGFCFFLMCSNQVSGRVLVLPQASSFGLQRGCCLRTKKEKKESSNLKTDKEVQKFSWTKRGFYSISSVTVTWVNDEGGQPQYDLLV